MNLTPFVWIALLSVGATASAQAPAPAPEDEALASTLKLPWTQPSGQGLALGLDNGLWGGDWCNGIRAKIPLGRHFAVHARGLAIFAFDDTNRVDLGGRLEFIGQSPVMLNVMRLYGGGGLQVFYPVSGDVTRKASFGGGGHFGFEFFMSPRYSWFIEVGGQGGSPAPGATVMAGMNFFVTS
jgi:hypothetical protein